MGHPIRILLQCGVTRLKNAVNFLLGTINEANRGVLMDIILSDVRAVAESMFLSGDWTSIAMIAGAIAVGVLAMKNVGQILCVSVLAMIVLGVIWVGYGGATSAAPADPATWISQLEAGWASMTATNGSTMVGYLITFAAAIGVLFIGKSLLFRG